MALGVVIVTGIYNVTQDTAHLTAPLLSVLYGRVLSLKLVFVTLAVLLGGYNRMIHLPHLANDGGRWRRCISRCAARLRRAAGRRSRRHADGIGSGRRARPYVTLGRLSLVALELSRARITLRGTFRRPRHPGIGSVRSTVSRFDWRRSVARKIESWQIAIMSSPGANRESAPFRQAPTVYF
jgi:hypothetical protein